ncbi:hypothetical protein HRR83_000682 [Exophiala dermatitidis]|uniref:BZIP domain-containing protein n=1 Tax=Exophiala dermatitidis TaxID=5970 RepID=A0AAN6IZ19_EXODE|nr:hypothetical protein HRR75_000623 [Exophiala dermatitidis]KAJ4527930.1 hypothetical protein HRR74_000685 [Exophiala dermatitidis]KAJ4528564.1 hypothetical protein HRR73_001187 [Exophiala dermatitidis]KAJ4529936.1 hypothetical protein HRR76_009183 [Exophiala dermatitidis]KAJ4552919.1 hypothetical protein HRR78_003178 [Exophiala dermatitidis]
MTRVVGIPDLLNSPDQETSSQAMNLHNLLNPLPDPKDECDDEGYGREEPDPGPKSPSRPAKRRTASSVGLETPRKHCKPQITTGSEPDRSRATSLLLAQSFPSTEEATKLCDGAECNNNRSQLSFPTSPGASQNGQDASNRLPPISFLEKPDKVQIPPLSGQTPRSRSSLPEPQTIYQLILPSDKGPPLVLPVEIQHPSRSPYSIKKRNALASARYRARKRLKAAEEAKLACNSGFTFVSEGQRPGSGKLSGEHGVKTHSKPVQTK